MLLRIESPFVQLTNKLGNPFSEEEEVNLVKALESTYDKIRLMLAQETAKEQSKPIVIKLGNLSARFFALNIYYSGDEMADDIPMSIRQLLPPISPVRIDILATISKSSVDSQENYINRFKPMTTAIFMHTILERSKKKMREFVLLTIKEITNCGFERGCLLGGGTI